MNKTVINRLEKVESKVLKKDILAEITDSGAINIQEFSSMVPVSFAEAKRVIEQCSNAYILFLDWRGVPEGNQVGKKGWHTPEDYDYQEWYELILRIEKNDHQNITTVSIEEN